MSDTPSGRVDRFGRRLSDDGRWYWDGLEWKEHFEPPPLPFAALTSPSPEPADLAAPADLAVPTDPGSATDPGAWPGARPPDSGDAAAPAWPSGVEPGLPPPPTVSSQAGPVLHRSPDGRWGWTGDRWVPVSEAERAQGPASAPPAPPVHVTPPPVHAPAPPVSAAGAPLVPPADPDARPATSQQSAAPATPNATAADPALLPPHVLPAQGPDFLFDPRGEAKRYPPMWRLAGRALRDVPALLEPGETVLATAPGEGDLVELRNFKSLTVLTGYTFDPAYLLVATDRRVLALGLTASASKVQRVHAFPYAAITHWSTRMSRAATIVTRTGFIALAAEPHEAAGMKRIPGQLFEEVRAQIEPRLDPAVLASGGKQ